jgi:hypothetical protein
MLPMRRPNRTCAIWNHLCVIGALLRCFFSGVAGHTGFAMVGAVLIRLRIERAAVLCWRDLHTILCSCYRIHDVKQISDRAEVRACALWEVNCMHLVV